MPRYHVNVTALGERSIDVVADTIEEAAALALLNAARSTPRWSVDSVENAATGEVLWAGLHDEPPLTAIGECYACLATMSATPRALYCSACDTDDEEE